MCFDLCFFPSHVLINIFKLAKIYRQVHPKLVQNGQFEKGVTVLFVIFSLHMKE